jgi:hypothetical protein
MQIGIRAVRITNGGEMPSTPKCLPVVPPSTCLDELEFGRAGIKPPNEDQRRRTMTVVQSAVQRAVRLSASLSPRCAMIGTAPMSGRNVVIERIGPLIMGPLRR